MEKTPDEKSDALVVVSEEATLSVFQEEKLAQALFELWDRLESPETRRGYRDDWNRYCAWLRKEGIDPRAARPSTVQRYVTWLRDQGKSKATRARALSVLREVYRALVSGEICLINPAREVKNPKVDGTPRTPWLNEEGAQQLFAGLYGLDDSWYGQRAFLILLTLFLLGWRRAEVARMRIEDFQEDTVRVRVKGGKTVTLGVPPSLKEEIRRWKERAGIVSGPLFPRSPEDSRAVSGKIIYDVVKTFAERAGLAFVTPHAIRRTFITILEARGVELRDLQLSVAHTSITTTERYRKAARAAQLVPGELLVDLVGIKKKEDSK